MPKPTGRVTHVGPPVMGIPIPPELLAKASQGARKYPFSTTEVGGSFLVETTQNPQRAEWNVKQAFKMWKKRHRLQKGRIVTMAELGGLRVWRAE